MLRPFFILLCMGPFILEGVPAQDWEAIEDFPGAARDDGVCFRIGQRAYCGTGLKVGWKAARDFYSYHLGTDTWQERSPLPKGEERQYATAFTHDQLGFVFGGLRDTSYKRDLWLYRPYRDRWESRTPLPAEGRSGAASFTIEGTAYIIGGRSKDKDALREVWAYEMEADSWERKDELPFGGRWRASASSWDGKGYLLFGMDEEGKLRDELYRYHPERDEWERISRFPGGGRAYAQLYSMHGQLICVGGWDGSGTIHGDVRSYHTWEEEWRRPDSLPVAGRRGGMGFETCSTIYYFAGLDSSSSRTKKGWKYERPVLPLIQDLDKGFSCHPVPFDKELKLLFGDEASRGGGRIMVHDARGRRIEEHRVNCTEMKLRTGDWPPGVYLIRYSRDDERTHRKVVKVGSAGN